MAAVTTDRITALCEKYWGRWKHDCSGFAHAVAADLGIYLQIPANAMIDQMSEHGSGWIKLGHNPAQAMAYANLGMLVIGGLKEPQHGHVVVLVSSRHASPYPVAYWGRLGGTGRENATINWAWKHADLANVEYFVHQVP